MISVSLGPHVAEAAKDGVRDAVTHINEARARSDGLPYKAAHHLYQVNEGKITHDEAWTATQQAIKEMIDSGELVAPTTHYDSWELNPQPSG
jgi:hypothetical protein